MVPSAIYPGTLLLPFDIYLGALLLPPCYLPLYTEVPCSYPPGPSFYQHNTRFLNRKIRDALIQECCGSVSYLVVQLLRWGHVVYLIVLREYHVGCQIVLK